jgi:hypothetical protein
LPEQLCEQARATSSCGPAEIGLGGGCALEQAACRLELRRFRAVGRARDRELDLRDVVALARERQRLGGLEDER